MLGQYAASAASDVDNRVFIYEVSGLEPADVVSRSQWNSRSSHNQFFQVPFHRMNQEMQRLTALGGKIINIQPLGAQPSTSTAQDTSQPETRSELDKEVAEEVAEADNNSSS